MKLPRVASVTPALLSIPERMFLLDTIASASLTAVRSCGFCIPLRNALTSPGVLPSSERDSWYKYCIWLDGMVTGLPAANASTCSGERTLAARTRLISSGST
ncbi:Uncharacterised protein [Mycobacteroides abscessus]|nr:Uncharacterised protein [Mycobacteroides abscessus]CPV17381.1 Uncharacterised protein [Mycobacteroides abscessus]CPX78931.1 Uncharacterised protein [Mycobacteroides abscessus]CQA10913.1 Uncharacterised protein [Mycobacteroides abscessus]